VVLADLACTSADLESLASKVAGAGLDVPTVKGEACWPH
jgi:hypothetical protein